jgi:hypothetical protein
MPLLLMDNPYRVTKDGFDWEAIEEHDPWSYIAIGEIIRSFIYLSS